MPEDFCIVKCATHDATHDIIHIDPDLLWRQQLVPSKRVLWEVIDGPAEWIGTTVDWELKQESDYTIILFKHLGWREPVEFMHHCSTKWGVFLMSLRALLETGEGAPHPNDVRIDNWGYG